MAAQDGSCMLKSLMSANDRSRQTHCASPVTKGANRRAQSATGNLSQAAVCLNNSIYAYCMSSVFVCVHKEYSVFQIQKNKK